MRRLLCSLLLPLAAPSSGATFDHDDRIAITRPSAQFLAIGIVKGGKAVAYATGFLVTQCHVLTVKHAAGRVANVTGRRMRFSLPFAGEEGTSVGTVVLAGSLDLVADPNRLDRSEDWLLLRLDHCLGTRFGFLALGDQADKSGPFRTPSHDALFSAGFPIDRSWRRQLTIDPQCRARRVSGPFLVHDCSSLPGNSGSPIFTTAWRDGHPRVEVVAMHSTAAVTNRIRPYRGEDGGMATRIADLLPAIRAYLDPTSPRSALASPAVAPRMGLSPPLVLAQH